MYVLFCVCFQRVPWNNFDNWTEIDFVSLCFDDAWNCGQPLTSVSIHHWILKWSMLSPVIRVSLFLYNMSFCQWVGANEFWNMHYIIRWLLLSISRPSILPCLCMVYLCSPYLPGFPIIIPGKWDWRMVKYSWKTPGRKFLRTSSTCNHAFPLALSPSMTPYN